jgi:hypothetical protein
MLRPDITPDEQRALRREVALTYRRIKRLRRAEGVSLQQAEIEAVDTAIAVYQKLTPDVPTRQAAPRCC